MSLKSLGKPSANEDMPHESSQSQTELQIKGSAEKYRDLLDYANDLIQSVAPDGAFLYVNRAWLETLGYEEAEVTRLNVFDIIPPECHESCGEILRRLLKGEQVGRVELDFVSKSGGKITVEGNINCKFVDEKPVWTRGIFRDITERKQSEENLRRSEVKYRTLIEQASDGIFISDKQGNFVEINRQGCEMLGFDCDELLKLNWKDIITEEDLDLHPIQYDELLQGKTTRIERVLRRKDGEPLPVEISARMVDDEQLQAIVRDISERKRAEEELSRSEKRYRNLVENARDIIYTHDLEGNYTSTNKAGEQITGYTLEETLRMNITQMVAPECLEKAMRMLERKIESEDETIYDLDIITKDGRKITVEVNTRLIHEGEKATGVQGIARDITDRKRSEEMFRFQKTLLESLSETSLDGILVVSSDGEVITRNRRFVEMWEMSERLLENWRGKETLRLVAQKTVNPQEFLATVERLKRRPDETHQDEVELRDNRIFERYSAPVKSVEGTHYGRVWYFRDVTERKQLEDRFRQSQKMEAVGQLAGGIAHDFNNLLTAINGYADLSLRTLPASSYVRSNVEQIKKASERAASLTRQLLAFSRKQVLQPIVFNLNVVVQDMEKMLGRLIGEDVFLRFKLDPQLGNVLADPGQIEQVLMNLIVNARDAMPKGGKLSIETANAYFDEAYVKEHAAGTPGRFVMLSVSDNGSGMDEQTMGRIFEPFFTTKELGKGTGLGLSTVYGIVKQSGGYVWVYSEPGFGTTFKVYLPQIELNETAVVRGAEREDARGGSETILLVEDEELLRPLAKEILESRGYKVFVASDAEQALALAAEYYDEIQLLLTDVVLPQHSGRALADAMAHLRPGIRVLYMSGYTDDAIVHHGVLDEGMSFIQKPFTPEAFAKKVRDVLDAPKT